MKDHIDDPRPDLLDPEQIEAAETPDELWNAAQHELVLSGEMHNYMRMLWGKRLIEWQPSYESAFALWSISIINMRSTAAIQIPMQAFSGVLASTIAPGLTALFSARFVT